MLRLLGVNRYPIECLRYGIVQRIHLTFTSFRSMQKSKQWDNVLRQAVPQQHTAYRLRPPLAYWLACIATTRSEVRPRCEYDGRVINQ